jgi:hypothetical protein
VVCELRLGGGGLATEAAPRCAVEFDCRWMFER